MSWMAAATALGAGLGFLGAKKQNQAQISSAREQMAFQERMRDTSYQAAMKDMRAAGLNPILAYKQGGAPAPGGAQANIRNVMEHMPASAANLVAAQSAQAQIENTNAQTVLTDEKAKTERAVQSQVAQNTAQSAAMTASAMADVRNKLIQSRTLSANATVAETQAKLADIDAEIYGQPTYIARRTLEKYGLTGSFLKTGAGVAFLKRFPAIGAALGVTGLAGATNAKEGEGENPPLKIDIYE